MHHKNEHESDILKGLAAGVVSGLVATWVMTQFQNAVSQMMNPENGEDKKRTKQKPESSNAPLKTAEAISETIFNHELENGEQKTAGNAVHYSFGTTMGALYGIASEIAPAASAGYGLAFGTTLFIGADEIAVPLLGLGKSPTETPFSKHIYGLTSHLVYGLTADFTRRAVRNIL